MRLKSEVN